MKRESRNKASGGLRPWLAGIAISLAGCSGGGSGGASTPEIALSFVQPSATVNEGASPLVVSVVLHTTLASTATAVTVDVTDAGTGGATVGADYANFGPQTVTFAAGSIDGDVRTITLNALDDHLVEGTSETVRLALGNATGGSPYGTTTFTTTIVDIHQATIQFSASGGATPNESAVPRSIAVTLDLPVGVALGTTASARVSDAGGGSATSGVDYVALAPVTVSFAPGAIDGTTQTVALQVMDDATIEANEVVRLGIAALAASTTIGATNQYQLTITDDDAPSSSAFAAGEGPTGVENPLIYDELVDLGSQTVATGPNAGTHVRVTNLGGSALSLGAPRLTGTNPNDFSVEVEAAPMLPPAASAAPGPDASSPLLFSAASTGPGVGVQLDTAQLSALSQLPSATMHGFPVPGLGDVALVMRRVPLPIADDAVMSVDGVEVAGGLRAAVGDLSLWTGSVQGQPNSRAFLALSSTGSRGFIDLGFAQDRVVHLIPDAASSTPGLPAGCRVVRESEMAAMGLGEPSDVCNDARDIPGVSMALASSSTTLPASTPAALSVANCRLAVETDYQLYQKFGSAGALTSYVTQLIAAVSDQYFIDVQTTLSIAYLGIYTSASDPWLSQDSGGNASALLDEFRAAWAPSNWPVSANLAHFISGASLGGGVAYVSALCNQSFGFGVSGNISGTINWGAWSGAPGNFTWDFVVVAHELGHNFGSNHTHSFCPPIDQCAANCTSTTICTRGTIMSYCHTCGGMSNIDLEFHPVCANVMRQTVNASCLGLSALAGGDYVQYLVRFNPMTATGTRSANLEFAHDASNQPQPFRLRLQGLSN